MLNRREVLVGVSALAGVAGAGGKAFAQSPQEVVIGAIYPLTGASAQVGANARHAFDTAAELINASFDLPLPCAKDAGLTGLGGAKVRVVLADHQGDPEKGAKEAERLITEEKVTAIIGAFHSTVSATASAVCENHSVPYMAADSSNPTLHTRGLKYFFRPSAHDILFSRVMFDLMDAQRTAGKKVQTVALFYEDTLFGTASATAQRDLAAVRGYDIVADIKFHPAAASLSSEVQQLVAAKPDVLMPSCYGSDAILLVKTMKDQGYSPANMIAQGAGFSDKAVYDAVGDQLDGVITRNSFSLDIAPKRPAVIPVNDMFKKRAGRDLDDNSSREFMALIIMADAINRAQSIEGPKVRQALIETGIPGDETIMPWRYVKFSTGGQSPTADPILLQYLGGKLVTIFPSEVSIHEPKWPMNG